MSGTPLDTTTDRIRLRLTDKGKKTFVSHGRKTKMHNTIEGTLIGPSTYLGCIFVHVDGYARKQSFHASFWEVIQ